MKMNRYTLCMAAAALFAALALTGCSLLKVAVATGDPLSKEEMNIRTMTRGFYYDMASEVSRTADSIAAAAPDIATRVAAVRWKIRATRAGVSAAMQGIPDVALADMWILCRRMDEGFAAAPDSLLFGAQSDLARDAAARLDRRAARLARQVLAVDRYGFSKLVTEKIRSHPNITVVPGEVTAIPEGNVIIASGPLTSDALAAAIAEKIGDGHTLNFFDAAAPLVTFESVDMDSAFFASRYDKGTADYINCPMTEEEYDAFWQALTTAEEASVHGFEDKNVFEGCMPVEVMARRGHDTLCYGPLKPRGLRDPKTGKEPYAVVQLRRDNAQGSVYNLVGFQTHLRFPEQKRVFSMIPALHDAEFVRYGVMHRNTYLRSPGMLDRYYRLIADDRIAFAGQMTGVEGYIESAASGFLAGIEMARRLEGKPPVDFPRETAIGALGLYISDTTVSDFQPMNVNFGIMPPLGYRIKGGKRVKNAQLAARSLEKIDAMREDVLSDRKGE